MGVCDVPQLTRTYSFPNNATPAMTSSNDPGGYVTAAWKGDSGDPPPGCILFHISGYFTSTKSATITETTGTAWSAWSTGVPSGSVVTNVQVSLETEYSLYSGTVGNVELTAELLVGSDVATYVSPLVAMASKDATWTEHAGMQVAVLPADRARSVIPKLKLTGSCASANGEGFLLVTKVIVTVTYETDPGAVSTDLITDTFTKDAGALAVAWRLTDRYYLSVGKTTWCYDPITQGWCDSQLGAVSWATQVDAAAPCVLLGERKTPTGYSANAMMFHSEQPIFTKRGPIRLKAQYGTRWFDGGGIPIHRTKRAVVLICEGKSKVKGIIGTVALNVDGYVEAYPMVYDEMVKPGLLFEQQWSFDASGRLITADLDFLDNAGLYVSDCRLEYTIA